MRHPAATGGRAAAAGPRPSQRHSARVRHSRRRSAPTPSQQGRGPGHRGVGCGRTGAGGAAQVRSRECLPSVLAFWLAIPQPPSLAQTSTAPPPLPTPRSVELASVDMKATVTLARLRAGPGYAIVIASVAPGSEAASAGVRPGQQLLQVSDPIRPNEVWQLNESSSLRHVRQAVRMRVPDTITLLLSREPIPEWAQHVVAARAAAAAEREQTQDPGRQQQQQQGEAAAAGDSSAEAADDLLSAIVQAASSGESMDSGDEGGASAGGRGGLTVAEKLEAQYRQQQEAEGGAPEAAQAWQALTALEKRQKRRKEYFEQVGLDLAGRERPPCKPPLARSTRCCPGCQRLSKPHLALPHPCRQASATTGPSLPAWPRSLCCPQRSSCSPPLPAATSTAWTCMAPCAEACSPQAKPELQRRSAAFGPAFLFLLLSGMCILFTISHHLDPLRFLLPSIHPSNHTVAAVQLPIPF